MTIDNIPKDYDHKKKKKNGKKNGMMIKFINSLVMEQNQGI